MKKLITIALLITAHAQATSGVNCNGMTAGPIWQNSTDANPQGSKVTSAPAKPLTKQPGQR
ncbi:MAG: hypothetical protein ACK5V3_17120 [Bdellovibrionales bacterium]